MSRLETTPPIQVPLEIIEAQKAFAHDLPQLLRERPGQWVAYCGSRRIGFDKSHTELYRACLRQGLDEETFVVQCIEPEEGPLVFGPLTVD